MTRPARVHASAHTTVVGAAPARQHRAAGRGRRGGVAPSRRGCTCACLGASSHLQRPADVAVGAAEAARTPDTAAAAAGGDATQQHPPSVFGRDHPRVVVVVSRDSGPQRGAAFAAQLRAALPADAVAEVPCPQDGWALTRVIRTVVSEPPCPATGEPPRVVVAGGDGTVSWVVDQVTAAAAAARPQRPAPVFAVLPYGTGNDLARSLGWLHAAQHHNASSSSSPEQAVALLRTLEQAPAAEVDRWRLRATAVHSAPRVVRWSNYLSIGFDAGVAFAFDDARRRAPGLFTSRLGNKAAYGLLGARDFALGRCGELALHVTLTCDSAPVALPPGTRGLLLLNIGSFMGGVTPWKSDDASHPGDGMLEVVAHRGALHLAAMQLGIDAGIPLGRASTIGITTTADLPMQADGEPWMQKAATVLEVTREGVTRFAVPPKRQ